MRFFVMANCSRQDRDTEAVLEDFPKDYPIKKYKFLKGSRMAVSMEEPLILPFSDAHPDGRKLIDLQHTSLGLKFVSARLRDLLNEEGAIEFIPVVLINHSGQVASEEYTIANFLDAYDCIKAEASDVIMNDLNPEKIFRIKTLALDVSAVPDEVNVFRIKRSMTTIIVKEPLKEKIEAAGMDGPLFVPVEEFDSALYLGV
jgi:hypothetical protein